MSGTPPPPAGSGARVAAVVVAYRPDAATLSALLAALDGQAQAVAVVDNGSSPEVGAWLREREAAGTIGLISPGRNLGVAAAQNLGIAWAGRQGATHVLLMDQDSLPQDGMVAALVGAWSGLVAAGREVAAVGPAHRDARTGLPAPFVRIGWLWNRHVRCTGESAAATVPADFLIASGTLIPLPVLQRVGGMMEAFFIDNVDLEWCFRATARGYGLYGVCGASMLHVLGDRVRRVWLGGWRQVAVHGPERLYYMTRNRLLLYRLPHAPWRWICQDMVRLCAKFLGFGLVVPPRLENARMMLRGARDALAGRLGPCAGPDRAA